MRVGYPTSLTRSIYSRSGAIDMPALAPAITGIPTVVGTATQGQTLEALPAPASGTPLPQRSWQWLRDGAGIPGATARSYGVTSADTGARLSVRQTETNSAGSVSAISPQTVRVPGAATVPAAFGPGDWSVTPAGPEAFDGAIIRPPADGGAAIQSYEFRAPGSGWQNIGLATTFGYAGLPAGPTLIELRANNAVGYGAIGTRTVDIAPPLSEPAPAPSLTLNSFADATDTAMLEADQDGTLHWAGVRGPDWVYGAGGFSGADVLETGPGGSFTVAGGAQAFSPGYTEASAGATTLLVGLRNTRGADTVSAAFTPNLPPMQMGLPSLMVDGAERIAVTLASAPEGYQNGVDSYDLRWRETGGTWALRTGVTSPYELTGLRAGTAHSVQTRAINGDGPGTWSATATVSTAPAVPGGGSGGVAFADAVFADVNDASFTFAGVNLGAASATRAVALVILPSFQAGRDIASVTVGGIPATRLDGAAATAEGITQAYLYTASVPSGATGDVVITGDESFYNLTIAVATADAPVVLADSGSDTNGAGALSTTIDVPAGGTLLALSSNLGPDPDNRAATWSGATGAEAFAAGAIAGRSTAFDTGLEVETSRAVSVEYAATWAGDRFLYVATLA